MSRIFVLAAVILLAVATFAFGQQGPSAQPGGQPGDLSNQPNDPQESIARQRKDVQGAFARLLKGEVPLSEVTILATDPAIKGFFQIYGSGVGFVDNVQITLTPKQIRDLLEKLDKGRFFELEPKVGVAPKGARPAGPPKGSTPPPGGPQAQPPMLQVEIGQDRWIVQQFRGGGDQSMQFSTLVRQLREAVTPLKANGLDLSKLTLKDAFEKLAKGEVAVEALCVSVSGKEWSFSLSRGVVTPYQGKPLPPMKLKAQLIQELAAKAGKANTAFSDGGPAKMNELIQVHDPTGQVDRVTIYITGVPVIMHFANDHMNYAYSQEELNQKAAQNAYAELAKAIQQIHDDTMKEVQPRAQPSPGGNEPQPRPGNPRGVGNPWDPPYSGGNASPPRPGNPGGPTGPFVGGAEPQPAKELTLDLGNKVTMKLAVIPAGKFMRGSLVNEKGRAGDEGPQREVTITKPFYMGATEVTQVQYEAVMGTNPSKFKGAQNPVDQVSWGDAVMFCKKLSQKTGKTVRLPTEAEWEYACRAGTKTRFIFGDNDTDLRDYAWYSVNSESKTHPVGQKKPNAWGLYDMHGNVWEWCWDRYVRSYEYAENEDPRGPDSGDWHVLRGGSWCGNPQDCRSARRYWISPGPRTDDLGFRVSVDLK